MSKSRQITKPGGLLLLITSFIFNLHSHAEEISYSDLEPILQQRCVICHSGEFAPKGLNLQSLELLLKGSSNGPVVIANQPEASELYKRLTGSSLPRMPMTGPPFLQDQEIDLFKRWIAAGLPAGPRTDAATARQAAPVEPVADEEITYAHVAPILATRCARCHTEQGLMGNAPEGYLLTSYNATLSSADRVRVVPGKPAASELLRRVKGQAVPRMPFDGPPFLSDQEIHTIEAWIKNGAPDSNGRPAGIPVGAEIRLHGRLIDGWLLDGLPLEVGRHTRLQKRPGDGDYVRVRGHLDAEGNVVADRIRRR